MKYQIIPSVIAEKQNELDSILAFLEGSFKHFQIDIMDGKFVKNKSNWFNIKLNKSFTYEAHLMVDDPEYYIRKNYKKFNIIITNFEKVKESLKLIKFVKSKKRKIGFALNPETSINGIKPYLKYLDRVLILTVYPGKYGAEFLPKTLAKIIALRKIYKKDIEVDGHINLKTIKLCKNSGANIFAVGSYLIKSKNLKEDIRKLRAALR